jgi:hypothetical protein
MAKNGVTYSGSIVRVNGHFPAHELNHLAFSQKEVKISYWNFNEI